MAIHIHAGKEYILSQSKITEQTTTVKALLRVCKHFARWLNHCFLLRCTSHQLANRIPRFDANMLERATPFGILAVIVALERLIEIEAITHMRFSMYTLNQE